MENIPYVGPLQKPKYLKRFFGMQNFSKALRIGFMSFNLSSLDKGG